MAQNDSELRAEINKLLDFFTEPKGEEVYLRDLEDDIVTVVTAYKDKAVEAVLDRLEQEILYPDARHILSTQFMEAIQTERNKLKESSDE